VLYSPTEVLLDCAAHRSLFPSDQHLRDVSVARRPVIIGGINSEGEGLRVEKEGVFRDLGVVSIAKGAAANILSFGELVDKGYEVHYLRAQDVFAVHGEQTLWVFTRKLRPDGTRSRFWTCDIDSSSDDVFVTTVAENLRRYTRREIVDMSRAAEFMRRMGHITSTAAIKVLNKGVQNCPVTATAVRNNEAAHGPSLAGLRGKATKRASAVAGYELSPRVTQVQQILHADLIFIREQFFLLCVVTPLQLAWATRLRDRGVESVGEAIQKLIDMVAGRGFQILEVRCDGEGAVGAMRGELNALGLVVHIAGPGQHVPVVERMSQTVKGRVRAHITSLPFVMPSIILEYCVYFCVWCVNLQPSSASTDGVSPYEQFSGLKLDAKRDLRFSFGDYIQATGADTDNSMNARTTGCIGLLPTCNLTGSVKMWSLSTRKIVTRDQFRVIPMPDIVIEYLTGLAQKQGFDRRDDPSLLHADGDLGEDSDGDDPGPSLPDMVAIDGRANLRNQTDNVEAGDAEADNTGAPTVPTLGAPAGVVLVPGPAAPATTGPAVASTDEPDVVFSRFGRRWSSRLNPGEVAYLARAQRADADRATLRRHLLARSDWRDTEFAFKISVRMALREREAEARPVIEAELRQMVDKKVWHGVHARGLTKQERGAIIRSSMFLKDKYHASGAFEKFKARLVAGGDQQDRLLYDNLSSPTAVTTSVLTIAAIAAAEGRSVMVMDIGGAFLNADITTTGVRVHMRLDKLMSAMLVQIAPGYQKFVEPNGTIVVQLDKALYGCVEAAALWYADLRTKLIEDGFVANEYDACVFNKFGEDGVQVTIAVHVDDLFVTSESKANLDRLESYMLSRYAEVKTKRGEVIDYLGMTFDFTTKGQVAVTMDNCINDILENCGEVPSRVTPAAETLFDVRDAPKVAKESVEYFRTHVAKLLYLAKRVRPECLTAIGFLTTRVHEVDADDMAKLKRALGYLKATRNRGIVLRIGEHMTVRAYIDAAYGVHSSSGKSHTGCAIVLGEGGPVSVRSTKQKIVTKSSTEAELVGLSDTASAAIHLRNFVLAQGYDTGPAVLYQDNLSCLALMKRGGPGSERSRHINIRHFWLHEKASDGEVAYEHLGTKKMFANALTKPVQGSQFLVERAGLTNWD